MTLHSRSNCTAPGAPQAHGVGSSGDESRRGVSSLTGRGLDAPAPSGSGVARGLLFGIPLSLAIWAALILAVTIVQGGG